MKTYYEMMPLCGFGSSVWKELRQLDRGFYGIGLPHPGVEYFVAQVNNNKLLVHYGCSSGLGIHMQVSMEMMVIEGGILSQLLSTQYRHYGQWTTHCWLRSLWEKVDMFQFKVEVCKPSLDPPELMTVGSC